MRLCDVPGCGRKHDANGMCATHRQRYLRYGDVLARVPVGVRRAQCDVEGCLNRHSSGGFCQKHYRRYRKFGDPLATAVVRAKPCAVHGCETTACVYGYCQTHTHRYTTWGTSEPPVRRANPLVRALHGAVEEPAPVHMPDGTLPCWIVPPMAGDRRRVRYQGVYTLAYRVTYAVLVAPIPDGLTLDHLCFRGHCVNPWHLDPCPDSVNTRRWIAIHGTPRRDPVTGQWKIAKATS